MRNLKRILALVMTLALCLGLSSVAFAASYDSFSDADQVTYEEAMDVLVALGVIEGTDNGTLSPAGTLTRETAAKIIAYLCLGGTAAEALSTGTSPFSDVDASRWSAGYIAYCANQGIINGRGDGTFDPTAEVSGYEFAKMLLCAIGYGENGEFTGSYWAINTAAYASQAELFEGGENINYNNAATREEAMLYAFNALTRPMTVKYSDTFSAYYSGTSPLNTIAEEDEYKYTLGYQSYGLYQGDAETDDFGRVGYVWEVDGEAVSDPYYEDAAATFTGYVTSSAIYNALGSKYAGDATLYVDGEQQDDFPIARGDTADSLGNLSAQVFVYADSDTYDVTIVVINTYVGQVTGVDEDEVTVTVYDSGKTSGIGNELYYGVDVSGTYDYETAAAFDEDEYVLVTVAGGDIQSMESADTIVGTMDASSTSYLIIDGTTYYKSDTYGELADVEGDYDSEYTFILDQNGYLLGSELYEEADADHSSYIYVTGSQVNVSTLSGTSAQIAVMYLDGTTDILDLYVTESNDDYYYVLNGVKTEIIEDDGKELTGLANGGFFRYSENSSGYVSLKALSTSSQKAVGYSEASFEVDSSTRKLSITGEATSGVEPSKVYLSSSTVLHVIDEDGDVTTVTGYSNIKGYGEENKPTLVFYSGSVVSDIYTFDGTWASAGNFALYVGKYTTSSDTYYRFYKDGETVTYTADEDLSLTVRSIYDLTVSNGVITDHAEEMAYGDAEKVTRTRTDYFTTDSGAHYYDDDVVVYDFTNGNAAATLSSGDYVVYAEEDGMVAAVYIVTDPSTTGDKDEDSADVEISNVLIGVAGNVNFTADTEGATVYVVVEGKYTYTGWVEEDTVEVTTADGNNVASFGLAAGTYRVTIYADEAQSERLFRGTFEFDGSTTTDPQG